MPWRDPQNAPPPEDPTPEEVERMEEDAYYETLANSMVTEGDNQEDDESITMLSIWYDVGNREWRFGEYILGKLPNTGFKTLRNRAEHMCGLILPVVGWVKLDDGRMGWTCAIHIK